MKFLWNHIENKNWKAAAKYSLFLWILGILFGVLGLILWSIVRIWALRTLDWMLCFTGYPAISAVVFVFLYSFHHPFHDGLSLKNNT